MPSTKKRSRRKKPSANASRNAWWLRPIPWIVAAGVVVVLALWWVLQPGEDARRETAGGFEVELLKTAERHGVSGGDLVVDAEIRKIDGIFVRTWKLRFADTASREEFIAEIRILDDRDDIGVTGPVDNVGGMISLRIDHGVEAYELELAVARPRQDYSQLEPVAAPTLPAPTATPRPEPPEGARGRLAILLDDAGQKMDLVSLAGALPPEVGVAVLPFLPYSTESALAFHEAGHEVWLHLPMEAVGGKDPGPGALTTEMSDAELHDAVFMAVNNIPHVVGVNNHMGSRATADLKMMTWVMQDLASMDLAFLDSRTTVETVAEEAARAQGVKTGRRHVFLDNQRDRGAISAQLAEAVYRSRMEGEIVAIGHLTEVTVSVLADELPGLSERRVTLVRPTALLR